jgi:hypothetical protein
VIRPQALMVIEPMTLRGKPVDAARDADLPAAPHEMGTELFRSPEFRLSSAQ